MQLSDEEKRELAEVYERAAEYLEEHGWTQLNSGQEGRPRCFVGATASAVGEIQCGHFFRVKNSPLWHSANDFAKKALELPPYVDIIDWNDDPDRSVDEVINTLHALANKLR